MHVGTKSEVDNLYNGIINFEYVLLYYDLSLINQNVRILDRRGIIFNYNITLNLQWLSTRYYNGRQQAKQQIVVDFLWVARKYHVSGFLLKT